MPPPAEGNEPAESPAALPSYRAQPHFDASRHALGAKRIKSMGQGIVALHSSHHCHTNSAYPVHGFLECEPSFDIQPNFHRTVSPAKYGPKLPRISEIKAREVIEADLRENIERSLTQVSGTNAATGIDRRAVEVMDPAFD